MMIFPQLSVLEIPRANGVARAGLPRCVRVVLLGAAAMASVVLAAFPARTVLAQPSVPGLRASSGSSVSELEDRVRYYVAVKDLDAAQEALTELGVRDPENSVFFLYGKMVEFAKTEPQQKKTAFSVRSDILTSIVLVAQSETEALEPTSPTLETARLLAAEPGSEAGREPVVSEPIPAAPTLAGAPAAAPEATPLPRVTPAPAPSSQPLTGREALDRLNALVEQAPGGWITIGTLGGLLLLLILIGIFKPRRIPVLEEPAEAAPPEAETPPAAIPSLKDITLRLDQDVFQEMESESLPSEGEAPPAEEAQDSDADLWGVGADSGEEDKDRGPEAPETSSYYEAEESHELSDYSLFSGPPSAEREERFLSEEQEEPGPESLSIPDKEESRPDAEAEPVSFGDATEEEPEGGGGRVPFESSSSRGAQEMSELDNPLDRSLESLPSEPLLDIPSDLPIENDQDTFFHSGEETRTHTDEEEGAQDSFFLSDDPTRTHAIFPLSFPEDEEPKSPDEDDSDTFFGSQDDTRASDDPGKE